MNNTELTLRTDVLALDKKGLQEMGASEATRLLDEGYVDASKLLVDSKKYVELLTAFNKAVKTAAVDELTGNRDGLTVGNAKITLGSTGDRLDYMQDNTYAELKLALDERAALLKQAVKMSTRIFDENGVEVPKVPVKTFGEIVPKISL